MERSIAGAFPIDFPIDDGEEIELRLRRGGRLRILEHARRSRCRSALRMINDRLVGADHCSVEELRNWSTTMP
jgi:hypothetical protein